MKSDETKKLSSKATACKAHSQRPYAICGLYICNCRSICRTPHLCSSGWCTALTVPKASIFLDENENQIGDHFTNQRRYWVGLDEMSPYLKEAVVAVEDKDFYQHGGFDYSRIAGAILVDIKAGGKVQGASTITQQYARNLYLSHEKSWTRKLNEALYAYRLEVFYDKDEILEGYLNTVYYGHGMYGVEAASRFYFGKSASDLTLAEAAMLTGVPKGPSIYSPIANLDKATNRQHVILKLMADQGAITQEEKTRAENEQLVLKMIAGLQPNLLPPLISWMWLGKKPVKS